MKGFRQAPLNNESQNYLLNTLQWTFIKDFQNSLNSKSPQLQFNGKVTAYYVHMKTMLGGQQLADRFEVHTIIRPVAFQRTFEAPKKTRSILLPVNTRWQTCSLVSLTPSGWLRPLWPVKALPLRLSPSPLSGETHFYSHHHSSTNCAGFQNLSHF